MKLYLLLLPLWLFDPIPGHGLSLRGFAITLRHTSPGRARVISRTLRPVPDNTQHSQQTDIHAPDGCRTRNPSKRAAANPRLIPRGHRDLICSCTSPVCLSGFFTARSLLSVPLSVMTCWLHAFVFAFTVGTGFSSLWLLTFGIKTDSASKET